jgi:hypothetical protein
MAQRIPEDNSALNQVLRLVEELSPEQREELRLKLNCKSWGERWETLSERIKARFQADGLPVPTDEEIVADVKAVRNERRDKLAQGGNLTMAVTKVRFTASVKEKLAQLVDEQAARLEVTRSDVLEQAMEMWLRSQADLEEERYFQEAAAEMNADAKDWNALTSQPFRKKSARKRNR